MATEFEVFARSLLMDQMAYCRMCLRLATERRMVAATSYQTLLNRILNMKKSVVDSVPPDACLCYVCDALIKRCGQVLDALVDTNKFAVLMKNKPIIRENQTTHALIIADQEVMAAYYEHIKSIEQKSKLCITETLRIDSLDHDPIDLTDEFAQPHNVTGIGNNIVLIPAKSNFLSNNLVVQQNSSLQNLNDLTNSIQVLNQPNNSILLNQPNNSILLNQPNNTILLNQSNNSVMINRMANAPVVNQVTNNVQVFNRDSSEQIQTDVNSGNWQLYQLVDNPTSTAPVKNLTSNVTQLSHVAKEPETDRWSRSVERVEDTNFIAIIETDISSEPGGSEGTCIVPDNYVEKPVRKKPEKKPHANILKPVSIEKLKPTPPTHTTLEEMMLSRKMRGPVTSSQPIVENPVTLHGGANLLRMSLEKKTATGDRETSANVMKLATKRAGNEVIELDPDSGDGMKPTELKPQDKHEVDWEDKIPMEVITYADEEPTPSKSFGTITSVFSQSQQQPTSPPPLLQMSQPSRLSQIRQKTKTNKQPQTSQPQTSQPQTSQPQTSQPHTSRAPRFRQIMPKTPQTKFQPRPMTSRERLMKKLKLQ